MKSGNSRNAEQRSSLRMRLGNCWKFSRYWLSILPQSDAITRNCKPPNRIKFRQPCGAVLRAALVHRQTGVCVAGMHGKTTTTALLTHVLNQLNQKPSYAVGALVPQLMQIGRA